MNNIQIFKSNEFGQVRTVEIDGEPWFAGKDVAEALGYAKPLNAIAAHVDEDDSLKQGLIDSMGRMQETIIINESGLYSLILGSSLGSAKRFKRWITAEVIPSIRKTGSYNLPQTYADALRELANKAEEAERLALVNRKLEEQNIRMRPKEIFADAVATSKTSILVGELAKLITQNGVQIGQNRMFKWLRENGYLISSGTSCNMPMQRYVEQGLFEIKESSIQNADGSVRITRTTKVTGKGQQYFINKFLKGANDGCIITQSN